MKTVEIIGYKRANLGKKESKRLRAEGNVPCVVYGSGEQTHFYAPMILFRPLVYTPEAHMVDLNIEGNHIRCILQDIQFHPVNEVILHADFLELQEKKPVKMDIPLHLTGTAPGVSKGGTLMFKRRSLRLKALPKDMPEHINVDVSGLDFGKAIKVSDVEAENFEILDNPAVSIAVIEVPRALRGRTEDEEEVEEGVEEGAEE
ncbi:large subunit ribosomal protein L25 [Catalinimonas alkaloidigena]|uniref:50S ribosomal protein L25/general stress protein Ctc n=1 Tax=Catalinimonas alkaloidigena TaxID=1075417 RepID=UPI00240616B8|nr:50S ribosomal protein L25/general stress protein Ctc [Catalinimonas alkaloidigena]MDF9797680.1 large subunit ribosomal protein L25 [Catalinimonas alkaloidigena]